jgi:hypothetical protein
LQNFPAFDDLGLRVGKVLWLSQLEPGTNRLLFTCCDPPAPPTRQPAAAAPRAGAPPPGLPPLAELAGADGAGASAGGTAGYGFRRRGYRYVQVRAQLVACGHGFVGIPPGRLAAPERGTLGSI